MKMNDKRGRKKERKKGCFRGDTAQSPTGYAVTNGVATIA